MAAHPTPRGYAPSLSEKIDLDSALATLPPNVRLCVVLVDPELTRLFAAADETLPPEQFLSETSQRLRRGRRLRVVGRLCVVTAVVAAAAGVAPFVADVSVDLVRYGGTGIEGFADLLVSPIGAVASMVVGLIVLKCARAMLR